MRHSNYILDGKIPVPCDDLMEWGKHFKDHGKRRVASDQITPDIKVSTVFLGMDHQWGQGPPLLFETMVFGGPMHDETDRYSTWEDAEDGHRRMVERVKNAIKAG